MNKSNPNRLTAPVTSTTDPRLGRAREVQRVPVTVPSTAIPPSPKDLQDPKKLIEDTKTNTAEMQSGARTENRAGPVERTATAEATMNAQQMPISPTTPVQPAPGVRTSTAVLPLPESTIHYDHLSPADRTTARDLVSRESAPTSNVEADGTQVEGSGSSRPHTTEEAKRAGEKTARKSER